MTNLKVNFDNLTGKVKPMHAVNNGPEYKFAADQRITNLYAFRDAGIPYARNHDASLCYTYGGEHTVDVANIFTDFDADPYDPESYDFALTDEYLKVIDLSGAKTFYRLGSKIEHWSKKYNTLPPKDFKKWAVICEHIIKHYTEGWADGFEFDIEYWEIWNEPDLDSDDSAHKRCWGGTKAEFFELYHIAATHLKEKFPHLKIGGPASAGNMEWADEFLGQLKAPLDFFSWHIYAEIPEKIIKKAEIVRNLLDKHGFRGTESILNEWNYVRGWEDDEWIYSLKTEKNIKGASFITATMCESQASSIDMLMYYDVRPGPMNGLFNTDNISEALKGYYPFKMFNELYKMSDYVKPESEEGIYSVASVEGDEAAILFTNYSDDDSSPSKEVKISVEGFCSQNGVSMECYLLDAENDMKLVREEKFGGESFMTFLNTPLFGSYLVKLKKL